MKIASLVVLFAIVSTSAFAVETVTCNQPGADGYKFQGELVKRGVKGGGQLKVPGERGSKAVMCLAPQAQPRHVGGDQTNIILNCGQEGPGYSIEVSAGGQLGTTAAIFFTGKNARTSKYLTTIRCNR